MFILTSDPAPSSIYSIFLFRTNPVWLWPTSRKRRNYIPNGSTRRKKTRERRTFGPRSLGSSSKTLHNSWSAPLRKFLFPRCIAPLQENHKIHLIQDTFINYSRKSIADIHCTHWSMIFRYSKKLWRLNGVFCPQRNLPGKKSQWALELLLYMKKLAAT